VKDSRRPVRCRHSGCAEYVYIVLHLKVFVGLEVLRVGVRGRSDHHDSRSLMRENCSVHELLLKEVHILHLDLQD
jgi:hypothetical protein